jgi:hypothetical protein
MKKIGVVLGLGLVLFLSGCEVIEEDDAKKQLEYSVCEYDNLPLELQQEIEDSKKEPFQILYANRDYIFIVIGYGSQQTGNYGIQLKQLYALRSGYYIQTELVGQSAEKIPKDNKEEIVYTPYIIVKTKRLHSKYSETLHTIP